MQTLDVISVNLWAMLVSLINLLLLFLIVKKFLYQPVQKMLEKRKKTLDDDYAAARSANEKAQADRIAYEEKLSGAKMEADAVMQNAVELARAREAELISDAKNKAEGILRRAEEDAVLERKKAEETIKEEIVVVSSVLAGKLLEREVKAEDHKGLIDSFLDELGEAEDGTH